MKEFARFISLILCCFLGAAVPAHAVSESDSVRADLLIMSPGKAIYSALGHAALRLSSPTYELDVCFTYGMDMRPQSQFHFLTGHAPAGYLVAPTEPYLEEYKDEERTVTAYELNLTLDEKRRLWKYLDQKVSRGLCDNYDYLHNGCAQVCLRAINAALCRTELTFHLDADDVLHTATCRERAQAGFRHAHWANFFWLTITGTEADELGQLESRIVLPEDLLRALQHAEFTDSAGATRPVLRGQPMTVVAAPNTTPTQASPYSPEVIALLLAALAFAAAIAGLTESAPLLVKTVDNLLLGIYALFTMLMMWLWVYSDLVSTSWNWLYVVYNPLPLLLWWYYRFHLRQPVPRQTCFYAAVVLFFLIKLNDFPAPHNVFMVALMIRLFTANITAEQLFTKSKNKQ